MKCGWLPSGSNDLVEVWDDEINMIHNRSEGRSEVLPCVLLKCFILLQLLGTTVWCSSFHTSALFLCNLQVAATQKALRPPDLPKNPPDQLFNQPGHKEQGLSEGNMQM